MVFMQRSLKTVLFSAASVVCLAGGLPLFSQKPDPILAEELVRKLQLLRERHEEDVREPRDFEVSEEEANAYLTYRLTDRLPEGVVGPWVRFSDGPVMAGAVLDLAVLRDRIPESSVAELLSGRLPVELAAKVRAEEGVGKLELESVTLGGLPIPQSFLQQIVTAYTKSPSRPNGVRLDEPFPLPYGIESASVERGRLFLRQRGSRESPGGDRR
jgi:hypothetical protein